MDVFDLRQQIVQDYANFARSFTRVRADDLKLQIDAIYAKDQFWPEPLLQITAIRIVNQSAHCLVSALNVFTSPFMSACALTDVTSRIACGR